MSEAPLLLRAGRQACGPAGNLRPTERRPFGHSFRADTRFAWTLGSRAFWATTGADKRR